MRKFLLTLSLYFSVLSSFATTWSEPWQKEIIQKSEYLIQGEIISATDTLVIVKLLNSFGQPTEDTINIDGFFMLEMTSSSGGGVYFMFEQGEIGYFFLKKGKNSNYQIPTPTSGFDKNVGEEVYCTYRHTYHQAMVSKEIYELTYHAIWNYYHGGKVDKEPIMKFINSRLALNVASFEEDEINQFYEQHVALETAYLLDIPLDFETLKKFASSDNYHSQISAVQAMRLINTNQCRQYLLEYIANKNNDNLPKVIAIKSIWEIADEETKQKLWKLRKKLSDDYSGFGGNIMDPRVGTYVPSPKELVIQLFKEE
jgi:hypothetical protein